ncbi:hypothetical protein E3N88_18639 [Mikania micrantha]|uniref:Integrase catalytic domain-containing protein n=1 Tax=Mikania micrantha TaxID=192012 RepID=A0A5N6NMT9_9ASTR|nr:hypothetical protein E3N88_18639 [Mikania micrantha]
MEPPEIIYEYIQSFWNSITERTDANGTVSLIGMVQGQPIIIIEHILRECLQFGDKATDPNRDLGRLERQNRRMRMVIEELTGSKLDDQEDDKVDDDNDDDDKENKEKEDEDDDKDGKAAKDDKIDDNYDDDNVGGDVGQRASSSGQQNDEPTLAAIILRNKYDINDIEMIMDPMDLLKFGKEDMQKLHESPIRVYALLTDNEAGTMTKHENLLSMSEYSSWSSRFELFLSIVNPSLTIPMIEAKRCEGNNQLKRSKRTLLKKQLEAFKCLDNETFDELITRYTLLLSEISNLNHEVSLEELNDELLGALPSAWETYVMIIRENTDLEITKLDVLITKLQSFDLDMQNKNDESKFSTQYHDGEMPAVIDDIIEWMFTPYDWEFGTAQQVKSVAKSDTPEILKNLFIKLDNEFSAKVKFLRSDNGTKFKNHNLKLFCIHKGITHQFSAPYTPQQKWCC